MLGFKKKMQGVQRRGTENSVFSREKRNGRQTLKEMAREKMERQEAKKSWVSQSRTHE